jgi:hypothetical protein
MRYFTDETIKKHIQKFGKSCYISGIKEKLETWERSYKERKEKLEHILERIEKDFD